MSLIRLNDVNVSFEKTQVLREAFFKLEAGDRVGLIGKNGSGKSTILKLIQGQVAPVSGTVAVELGTKAAYFSQFSELNGESTIAEVLDGLFAHVKEIEAELAGIDAAIAADSSDAARLDELIHRQSELFEDMDRFDGWVYLRCID
jgi:ATPase subunit of ABC transporter with duplicated ATPase domains